MAVAQSKVKVNYRKYKQNRRLTNKVYAVCEHIPLRTVFAKTRHEEKDISFSQNSQVCPLCFKYKV